MKRWFYILLGGFGVMLMLFTLFILLYQPPLPIPMESKLPAIEISAGIVGLVLGWVGFLNGRRAGEFDISRYNRSARKRDHRVNGTEIDYACPACHKIYRGSPLLAGKPFRCRECGTTFIVQSGNPPLPAAGASKVAALQ